MSFAYANQRKNRETQNKISNPSKHSYSNNNNKDAINSNQDFIYHLQRTIDNQAVQRLMGSNIKFDFAKKIIQPKLKVSQPGDAYEQEADRVADDIMHMPERQSIDVCPCGGGCPRCKNGKEKKNKNVNLSKTIQPKLKVSQPGDAYEQEADRVAEHVMRIATSNHIGLTVSNNGESISRKCSSCEMNKVDEEEQEIKKLKISRKSSTVSGFEAGEEDTDKINNFLSSGGSSLDNDIKEHMESRFGYDFGKVRIHTDEGASKSTRSLGSLAYTVGNDVIFGEGQYQPHTDQGRRLLAHELVHVVQQDSVHPHIQNTMLQRQEIDDKPKSGLQASSYRQILMHFDGSDLIVSGDGQELYRYSAQSGRPIIVSDKDAAQCGANPVTDTYMNDSRFVGITDSGPIPEGTYTLSPQSIETFSFGEQLRLTLNGIFGQKETMIRGHPIHSGDWGSGRVPLRPQGRLREGPCGNTNTRSGFFLHGGKFSGSSGCIDIGPNFDEIANFLSGSRRLVTLTVAYEHPPPSVRFLTGLSGALAYKGFHLHHGPELRLGTEFAHNEAGALTSVGYNIILQWAGGALSVGANLDVSLKDQETFVRAGLAGGLNFRLLRALYGKLSFGYDWSLSGNERESGLRLGGGLEYDFGRPQLELLYNMLRPFSNDSRGHQILVGIGFHF